ncbi:ABC transporter substrate-binding protein [Frigidibacter sp.]|uniref:ABC transporter substrate-binding protein n=1 Tax=Frigidibacter sp. TaxID=2586418 RepID=UPI0027357E8F|nr:ABC transporter substrate-binding protein [Frigidibacter sp.]MDP3339321.1 ABC transporter substrate-binding protein [Frigidibacter sp.]
MVGAGLLSRRRMVAGALVASVLSGRDAFAGVPGRIVALDWAMAETLAALGAPLVAVAEAPLYAQRVVQPALPAQTQDVGLRSWPNLEALRALRPDLIVTMEGYGIPPARLERIAPVRALPLYSAERKPLALARRAVGDLAALTGRHAEGAQLLAALDVALARGIPDDHPLLIVKFADDRLLDVYGPGSLFHDVLAAMGLRNAWTGPTNSWGFATAGLDQLARYPAARLVIIEPAPPARLLNSALWRALPQMQAGQVTVLPPVWVFGGVPSAIRFADLLGAA